jgi:glycosyltransferase involved in cell wall biosynthesis
MIKDAALVGKSKLRLLYVPLDRRDYLNFFNIFRYVFLRRFATRTLFVNQLTFYQMYLRGGLNHCLAETKVFFTHLNESHLAVEQQVELLNKCSQVLVMNLKIKEFLIGCGVLRSKVCVIYGGIDRSKFFPQADGVSQVESNPYVLIAGDCKDRKNPHLISEVISEMPNQRFLIHGRYWEEFFLKTKRFIPENVIIKEFDFTAHPTIMRNASAYLSLSKLEGGPYPVIEALASGTPVVVTDAGWNTEFVNEFNGRVLPLDVQVKDVIRSISEVVQLKGIVKHTDLLDMQLSMEELAHHLFHFSDIGGKYD